MMKKRKRLNLRTYKNKVLSYIHDVSLRHDGVWLVILMFKVIFQV